MIQICFALYVNEEGDGPKTDWFCRSSLKIKSARLHIVMNLQSRDDVSRWNSVNEKKGKTILLIPVKVQCSKLDSFRETSPAHVINLPL